MAYNKRSQWRLISFSQGDSIKRMVRITLFEVGVLGGDFLGVGGNFISYSTTLVLKSVTF